MSPQPTGGMHFDGLVNEAEALVAAEIPRQLDAHPGMCRCEECLLDIAACALNDLRPRYRVALLDRGGGAQDAAYAREVRAAVARAIARVQANPSHD